MKLLKKILELIYLTFLGMYGGQKKKGARRFGIPFSAIILGLKRWTWKYLSFLLLIPILCMGYGVNSFLMDFFQDDTMVRVAYGFILSLPFIVFSLKRWIVTAITLMIAFCIRAGSLGSIGDFDILIEDIIRYSVLGFWILFSIYKEGKNGEESTN